MEASGIAADGGGKQKGKRMRPKKHYAANSFKVRDVPLSSLKASVNSIEAAPLIGQSKKIRKHKENAQRFLVDTGKKISISQLQKLLILLANGECTLLPQVDLNINSTVYNTKRSPVSDYVIVEDKIEEELESQSREIQRLQQENEHLGRQYTELHQDHLISLRQQHNYQQEVLNTKQEMLNLKQEHALKVQQLEQTIRDQQHALHNINQIHQYHSPHHNHQRRLWGDEDDAASVASALREMIELISVQKYNKIRLLEHYEGERRGYQQLADAMYQAITTTGGGQHLFHRFATESASKTPKKP